MKAIHSFGLKDVRIVTVPDPIAGEGQVVLAIKGSGICGSDKWLWRSVDPVTRIAGHEVAGEVVALGPGVKHLQVGDRVAVNNVGGCGVCAACRSGMFTLCPQWDGSLDVNGGFAERVAVWERNCMKLADEIDYETACLIFDNLGTPYTALELAGVGRGDEVLVTGCGPIGMAGVLLAKQRGAYVIAADPLSYRRDFALRMGADAALPSDANLPGAVYELTSGVGVRVALECSGKSPAYPLALASLRFEGKLMTVGEGGQLDMRPSDLMIRRRLTIQGSWYSGMPDGRALMEMIRLKQLDPRVLVTHRGSLDEFPQVFAKACEFGDDVMKAVILN